MEKSPVIKGVEEGIVGTDNWTFRSKRYFRLTRWLMLSV
jgi:hypothetical protein